MTGSIDLPSNQYKSRQWDCRAPACSTDTTLNKLQQMVDSRNNRSRRSRSSKIKTILVAPRFRAQANQSYSHSHSHSQMINDEFGENNVSSAPFPSTGDPGFQNDVTLSSQSNAEEENPLSNGLSHIANVKNTITKHDLCGKTLTSNEHDALTKQQTVDKGDLVLQDNPKNNEAAIYRHDVSSKDENLDGDHMIKTEAKPVMLQTGSTMSRSISSSSIVPPVANVQLSTSSTSLALEYSTAPVAASAIPALPVAPPLVTNELNAAAVRTELVTQAVVRRDPYRNGKRINESIFAFPASGTEISMEHRNSFAVIAHKLRQNIEAHRAPIPAEPRIDIDLLMTGSCKADAEPSIVVTCDKKIFAHLETILYLDHIQDQHNLVILKKKPHWRGSWRWQVPKKCSGTGPRYHLCIRVRDVERVELGAKFLQCLAEFEDVGDIPLWCGSKIVQSGTASCATLSCILRIDDNMYGLTTAHSFNTDIGSSEQLGEAYQLSSDGNSHYPLLVPNFNAYETEQPDLDWALISMPHQPNITAGLPIVNLGSVVREHPQEERDVFILSSVVAKPRNGVLLCGTTVSGADFAAADVQYWNVELEYDDGMFYLASLLEANIS